MKYLTVSTRVLTAFVAVAALFGSSAFSGCGGKSDQSSATTRPAGERYGGTYTLNILRGDPKGLDPVLVNSKHADDIASQIFDHLVDLNERLELVPELAKEVPAPSSDGRIYRFGYVRP